MNWVIRDKIIIGNTFGKNVFIVGMKDGLDLKKIKTKTGDATVSVRLTLVAKIQDGMGV